MKFKIPPRLQPGDKVAILSPSAGLPAVFPWVYELGLKRLREVFHLEPVEFPTARKSPDYLAKNPEARAQDINAAFADPSIKAIIATIGGNDQIHILPYLDADVIAPNPKSFLGYSDNTSLHLYLWNLKVVSYYGGNLMNQFAMQANMHDFTVRYLKKALFDTDIGEIHAAPEWTDFDLSWEDPQNLSKARPLYPNDGWHWHNPNNTIIEGRLWGGCLEVLDVHFLANSYLPPLDQLKDCILYLETSEEMPSAEFVYRFLASLGKLGILQKFKGLLFARPKAQFCGKLPPEGREAFFANQIRAVKKALKDYDCNLPTVFNLNFGHTEPQIIIPNGGNALIDGTKKTIRFFNKD
jgi:muramoyltetrapeptide carboxypeptidase LdcA involved in peptidoglycan recycling